MAQLQRFDIRSSGCQMALQNTGANDDWWKYQTKWSGITESVQHGRIRPSVGQQYRQELVRQNKLESILGLRELYDEINALASLEDDWNAEDAPVIDKRSLHRAQSFVGQLAGAEYELNSERDLPSVSPTVDGGVQLYWNIDNRQLALTFRPGRNGVEYLLKKQGELAQRRSLMVNDAIAKVLQTMRDA